MATRDLAHYEEAVRNVGRRSERALSELHLDLQLAVLRVCADMEYRVAPWTGFRSEEDQKKAWLAGHSNAYSFGSSPHNYKPALACDLVLNPTKVPVKERGSSGWPDLWDETTPEAVQAWSDLAECAARHGLERVRIRRRGRLVEDKPHVQLRHWKRIAGLEADGD